MPMQKIWLISRRKTVANEDEQSSKQDDDDDDGGDEDDDDESETVFGCCYSVRFFSSFAFQVKKKQIDTV